MKRLLITVLFILFVSIPAYPFDMGFNFGFSSKHRSPYGPELVTNGRFTDGTSGWAANNVTQTVTSGVLELVDAGSAAATSRNITTEIGKTYRVSAEAKALSVNTAVNIAKILIDPTSTTTTQVSVNAEDVTQLLTGTFIATSTVTSINLQCAGGATGDKAYFANVSVRKVLYP